MFRVVGQAGSKRAREARGGITERCEENPRGWRVVRRRGNLQELGVVHKLGTRVRLAAVVGTPRGIGHDRPTHGFVLSDDARHLDEARIGVRLRRR